MSLFAAIAALLWTDVASLSVLAPMAAIGACFMAKLLENPRLALVFFPILLIGALLADDIGAAFGVYPWLTSKTNSDGTTNLLLAGTAGLCIGALLLLTVLRPERRDGR